MEEDQRIETTHVQVYGKSVFYEFQNISMLEEYEEKGFGTYKALEIDKKSYLAGVYVVPEYKKSDDSKKRMVTFAAKVRKADEPKVRNLNKDSIFGYLDSMLEIDVFDLRKESKRESRKDGVSEADIRVYEKQAEQNDEAVT